MKSNKGFTLIELLAVIVILAIIALIATPTILGVIDTARKGAAESTVLGYVDEIEKQIVISELDESATKIENKIYTTNVDVDIKGEAPTVVSMKIENGEVAVSEFKVGDYTVYYLGNGKASAK